MAALHHQELAGCGKPPRGGPRGLHQRLPGFARLVSSNLPRRLRRADRFTGSPFSQQFQDRCFERRILACACG